MKKKIFVLLSVLLFASVAQTGEYLCNIENDQIVVKEKDKELIRMDVGGALNCIFYEGYIYIARGAEGVEVFRLDAEKRAERRSPIKVPAEAIGFKIEGDKVYIITAIFSQIPLAKSQDGSLLLGSLAYDILTGKTKGISISEFKTEKAILEEKKRIYGKVIEVTPGFAIINLGAKDGVENNMRFEIQSSEPRRIYNLQTKTYEMMPSLETTAVSPVVQVSEDRCMIRIGRGNKADIGDVALLTEKPLSESLYTPSYEKDLHRIYARIAPFIGIETLTIGSLISLMYDYTFQFPLRIEGGLRNTGLLFSTENTSPFQFDLIPSYNTDLFEVGLGTGYSYSGHKLKRNFLFLQKVRLGAVDGINFTMRNSFIYQERHESWSFFSYGDVSGTPTSKEGDPCIPGGSRDYEFAWNGFDIEASTPLSRDVSLFTHWAYSQAGWFIGEIGIKNFVKGNGGDGTLIIPVSIGGSGVFDYKSIRTPNLICNPDTRKLEYERDWDSKGFGGPIVSIGIDYRWK